MPIFEYRAIDDTGKSTTGTLHGATQADVSKQLKQRGLTVQLLQPARLAGDPIPDGFRRTSEEPTAPRAEKAGRTQERPTAEEPTQDRLMMQRNVLVTAILGPLVGKVALQQQLFFFRQLSAMLNAGVNPMQCFDTLSRQTQSPKLRKIILELKDQTNAGRPMSFGMQRYPEVFTPLTMSLVRAGEEGGFLDESLTQVADYLEREIAIRNLIRRVTIYPKLVIGASIVILVGANMVIQSLAPNSPVSLESPLTKAATWVVLLPVIVALFLFVRIGLQNQRVKYNWDLFVTMIPGIGKTSRQFAMAKFGRALGALYRGGVPVHRAFKLSADACGNEYLRARMYPAFTKLEGGSGIAETLRGTGAFNEIVLDMTATGEQTGNLDKMLNKMAEYYEGEAETRSVQMGWTIGVVALLVVACYVGYLYVTNLIKVFAPIRDAASGA